LLKPADFNRVFKGSTASADRYFKILGRPNGLERSRLGMAVSRKVDKRAVGRNRIKRLVRESFRKARVLLHSPDQLQKPGIDVVVLPRTVCATISSRQLSESLDAHWSRLAQRVLSKRSVEKR
jgi:ribonuclease P protein component